jgi:hypothetical protein
MRRALLLFLLAGTSVASAQPKKAPPPKAAPAKKPVPAPRGGGMVYVPQPSYDGLPHKEGEYGGVHPGVQGPKDKPPKPKRPPPKGTLSWIGFEPKNGGASLFFQSVAPFEIKQKVEGTTLVVHLNLVRMGANTWRTVDTRYFDNPLSFIVARQGRGGIDIKITFKNPKDVREGTVRAATADADGMYYAYLAFPEGTGDPKPQTVKDPEPNN